MYNNNDNDNKCGAIYSLYYMCVCTYSKTPMPTYHAQTGWLDRAREDSVAYTYTMRHIAHHNITHTHTHIYTYTYIYHNVYITYTY